MREEDIIRSAIDIGTRCGVTSWMELKKILLVSLPSSQRSKFSTRDPISKSQNMNEMEHSIVDNYRKETGITLEVPQ